VSLHPRSDWTGTRAANSTALVASEVDGTAVHWNGPAVETLHSLTANDLLKTVTIRQEPLLVLDAINRQLAHYPHHIGQIIHIGKIIRDTQWKNLSIPVGKSDAYNKSEGVKDPAKLMGR
jgi:hypothetical protein